MRLHIRLPLAALGLFAAGTVWVLARDVSLGPPLPEEAEGLALAAPDLELGRESVRGRLLGADGSPLAGASLYASLRSRPLWTTTEADGSFILQGVDAGPLTLSVMARGYVPADHQVLVGDEPVELRLGERVLERPELADPLVADLVGAVELPMGRRDLSGYEVYLEPQSAPDELGGALPRRALVGADGSFQMPQLIRGSYWLRLLPPYAAGGSWPDLLTGLGEPPTEYQHSGDLAGLRLTMKAGELEGVALERAAIGSDPAPLEGALVRAEPAPSGAAETAETRVFPAATSDAEGRWRLQDLPPGRYRLFLTAGGERREAFVTIPAGTRVDPGL